MTGKTGVLAVLVAAFFCWYVSAAASEVQGLVPTRDGGRSPTTEAALPSGVPQRDLPTAQARAPQVPLIEHSAAAHTHE